MPSSSTKTHPLRRISAGSLSSLARSQDKSSQSTAASGLDFLQPALTDLADEAATLAGNVQNLTRLYDALGIFNESFAGYLYALKMNAFCVEWPEAPDERSFARAASLAPPPPPTPAPLPTPQTPGASHPPAQSNNFDTTYATIYSNLASDDSPEPVKRKPVAGARVVSGAKKPVVSLAERRKREAAIAAIIETLPLEYRGSAPATRTCMEKVLTELMAHPTGRKITDIVKVPELPQAKVNKALITLVNKKLVGKTMIGGATTYRLL